MKNKQTPYQRIMLAAKRHCGVRLTATEVRQLSGDSAISERALYDDDDDSNPEHVPHHRSRA